MEDPGAFPQQRGLRGLQLYLMRSTPLYWTIRSLSVTELVSGIESGILNQRYIDSDPAQIFYPS
jgi:hypothetical protein